MTRNGKNRAALPQTMLLAPVPAELPAEQAAACLHVFATMAPVAGVLLPAGKAVSRPWQTVLRDQAQELSIACLLLDDVGACLSLGADGVLLHDATPALVRRARERLGSDRIVGICCPTRRHALMVLGEAGADWLGVDQRVEAGGENLLAWAVEMFTLPVAAMQPAAPQEVAQLRSLSADFIVPLPEMWESPERAAELAMAYAAALDA